MRGTYALDLVLVVVSAMLAFAVARGKRDGNSRIAQIIAFIFPMGLVVYSQWMWASTGFGLVDRLTCAALRDAKICAPFNEAQHQGASREAELGEILTEDVPSGHAELSFHDSLSNGSSGPEMVLLSAGRFLMGSPIDEVGRFTNEGPQNWVNVHAFSIGKYEVTWDQYNLCVNAHACSRPEDDGFGQGSRPVTNVNWDDAITYTFWLSQETKKEYRLPTESEWEYAARAGGQTRFSFGDEAATTDANFRPRDLVSVRDKPRGTVAVGQYSPNAFHVYDMHGNVMEWVQDCFDDYRVDRPVSDSRALGDDCRARVVRGGSWRSGEHQIRSAYRNYFSYMRNDGLGFRVARVERK